MPPQDQPPQQQPAPHPGGSYEFIMNPAPPPKKPLFGGADSTLKRVGLFGGGFLVLIILIAVGKNVIVGKPKLDSLVTVAQDQQELIHLATEASQQQNLSADNKNMIATVNLSITSVQSDLMAYFSDSNFKVNAKTLNLGISSSLDTQLTNAATAGTYNQSLQDAMKQELNNYIGDMQQAYTQLKGPKVRSLLSSDYNQAKLLLNQLNDSTAGI
ncbi:MAG TPA: hypothetical protein VLG27_00090 [Candidatus Saccharimonadia bacterium]|nr:hypothetical protein [Candidatus Saccharimonadia bacterium]